MDVLFRRHARWVMPRWRRVALLAEPVWPQDLHAPGRLVAVDVHGASPGFLHGIPRMDREES
jgi:hypothetical protein